MIGPILKDKVAIVTGGAQGMGAATAILTSATWSSSTRRVAAPRWTRWFAPRSSATGGSMWR